MRSPSEPHSRDTDQKPPGPPAREDRLKAALKANMARRKAQARAKALVRGTEDADGPLDNETDGKG
jgi:hypothetical protein